MQPKIPRRSSPQWHERPTARWSVFLVFLGVFLIALAAAWPALDLPFFWDDLHLIRVHTRGELVQVWTGTWDTDQVETPGFRPVTALFNHLRAVAFGESVVAHRVFLVLLLTILLGMAGVLARELFSAGSLQLALGALIGFFHIGSVSHYVWITDGVFVVSGILILGAALALAQAWSSGRPAWLAVALVSAVLALLTREDAAVVYALLIWFWMLRAMNWTDRGAARPVRRVWWALFAAGMLTALALYWWWRAAKVPGAFDPEIHVDRFAWAVPQIAMNAGTAGRLLRSWPAYSSIIALWGAWLALVVLVSLRWLGRREWLTGLGWAGAMLIAAAPALTVARAHQFVLPIAFWGLLLAHVLMRCWTAARSPLWRMFLAVLIGIGVLAPAVGHILLQREQRPNSMLWMCANYQIVYDERAAATVPEARRDLARTELNSLGISRPHDFKKLWPEMIRQASEKGQVGPDPSGLPFIPRLDFLPMYPSQWSCVSALR